MGVRRSRLVRRARSATGWVDAAPQPLWHTERTTRATAPTVSRASESGPSGATGESRIMRSTCCG